MHIYIDLYVNTHICICIGAYIYIIYMIYNALFMRLASMSNGVGQTFINMVAPLLNIYTYLCYNNRYICYINIYFTIRKINTFVILQMSSQSFQCN